MKKRFISIGLGLVIIFILYNAISTNKAKGFIWEASKGKKSIYLIGTLHPGKSSINYENKTLNNIMNETEALAVEVDVTDKNNEKELTQDTQEKMYLKEGEIKDLLSNKEKEKFDKILKELDINYGDVKNLTPSGFSDVVNAMIANEANMETLGTEGFLINNYKSKGKVVIELENHKIQSMVLESDEKDLKAFVNNFKNKDVLFKDSIDHFNNIVEAYIKGDETYFLETEAIGETKINKERNINMADKIDKLAKENKRYAAAIGTYHFFGKYSILKNLENKGYSIRRLEC